MPVLDGYSAVEIIRREGATLPIIALTANGLLEDEKRCRDVGCTDYLTKPITMDDLLVGVARNLKNEQPHLCLLYTSPSPRDQRGSRMPSSA